MNHDLRRFLTDLAVDRTVAVDHHELVIAAATHTDAVKAWCDDLGRLAATDQWRHILADAFDSVIDLAGDSRLDGALGNHAALLCQITGAVCDLNEEHDLALARVRATGRQLGILDDLAT